MLFELNEKHSPISTIAEQLEVLLDAGIILLGGDILDSEGHYTYDNWYYEYNPRVDDMQNSRDSINKAKEYLEAYIDRNGTEYTVAIVVRTTNITR